MKPSSKAVTTVHNQETTIIFDLDGTLIDPKIGITTAVQYSLKSFGIDETTENLLKFIGPPLPHSFQEFYGFDREKTLLAVEKYREYFTTQGMFEGYVYSGVIEMLQRLVTQNRTLYIATSKPTVYAEKITEHFGLQKYFRGIYGSKLDLSDVDKPTIISRILALYPAKDRSEFVMIGDRSHDIVGAQANGIQSVGVLYGYGSANELESAQPTHIVSTVSELTALLSGK